MDKKYVIGVDGGNSKTDYFLFDVEGNFIDHLKDGTCSHERFPDSYLSARRIMDEKINELLRRNGLTLEDIAAGAFGLAGVDVPVQQQNLSHIISEIGFKKFEVDNDSFLGIKAGTSRGFGVCSINGSGSVTGGIDPSGNRLQVGGIGSEIAGDEAGGYFLARRVVRTVYDSLYRMGPATALTEPVMKLLEISDKYFYIQKISELVTSGTMPNKELMQLLFSAADSGDAAAVSVVENCALQLAKSTAGCITNLSFQDTVEVVLAGSVWVKAETPILFEKYKEYLSAMTDRTCVCNILSVPPATGAVLWALELVNSSFADTELKKKVIAAVEQRI